MSAVVEGGRTLLVILMGSPADRDHAAKVAATAARFGLTVETRIGSAHKTPRHVLEIIDHYEADPRPKVWVTIAGRSNALSAFVDAAVSAPVIACPPPSDSFGGADIFSSLRMPAGVAPAVVLEPVNAALFAAKILGKREQIKKFQTTQAEKLIEDHKSINS